MTFVAWVIDTFRKRHRFYDTPFRAGACCEFDTRCELCLILLRHFVRTPGNDVSPCVSDNANGCISLFRHSTSLQVLYHDSGIVLMTIPMPRTEIVWAVVKMFLIHIYAKAPCPFI